MTRWMILVLALVAGALVVVIGIVLGSVARERSTLVDRLESDHERQLAEAASAVSEEFGDVADDLRFAGELVRAADTATDREREIGALLAIVRHYRSVRVYDAEGALVLARHDAAFASAAEADAFAADMTSTARRARDRRPGDVETSPVLAADTTGWYRVFATALPSGGAIAILVDTQPLVGRLKLLAAGGSARLLLLGAHGTPLPATDAGLAAIMARPPDAETARDLDRLGAAMRQGPPGVSRIDGAAAARLGLGRDEAIVVVERIPLPGGDAWSVATLVPTTSLRAHDRAILQRAVLGTVAIAVCLLAFGAYVVLAARRAATMRERLRHADTLAHIHDKTEKILENIPAGVLTVSDTGTVTAMNRVLREQLPAATVGLPLARALPDAAPEAVTLLGDLVARALEHGRVQSVLGQRLQLFAGEGRYALHAVPLEQRFPEARVILVIDDLTALGELEAQLLAAEKHATVGVLAAGIAHEIGTPLGVARARAEYLASKLGREPLAESARVIIDQVDLVSRTIRQLLDFSRRRQPDVQPVSLPGTAHAVVELLRFEAERRRIRLEVDAPEPLPSLAADPDQLQQALVNLIMNSCDACAAGASIVVRARPEAQDARAWVRVEVADTGCGIPEELHHRVFDPFFTTKKRGQGTGLGLTLTAQIVRNHGGQIDLDSAPGRGTTISMRWPAASGTEGRQLASA